MAFAAALLPIQAEARWYRAETEKFVIYSDGSEREVREQAGKLADFDLLLRLFHNPPPDRVAPPKFSIYLLKKARDLKRVHPTAGDGVGGFYLTSDDLTFGLGVSFNDWTEANRILFHEYTHHFMKSHFPYPYPTWLFEGWAEYFADTGIYGDAMEVGRSFQPKMLNLARLPLEKLLTSSVSEIKADDRLLFYHEAWFLTHYMLSDPDRAVKLNAYMRAVAAGEHPARAMEKVTGQSLAALERALEAYGRVPLNYLRIKRQRQAGAVVTIAAMSPAADDLILEDLRLQSFGVAEVEAPTFVANIRTKASRYRGDRFSELVLARAEVFIGDRAAGEGSLDRMLAANPNDVDVLRLLGKSRILTAADAAAEQPRLLREARAFLAKAQQLAPNDYATLYAYAKTRSGEPGFPDDNSLDILLLVRALAPSLKEVELRAVDGLVDRKRYDEAIMILRRLAADPHGGATARAASVRLEQISALPATAVPDGAPSSASAD